MWAQASYIIASTSNDVCQANREDVLQEKQHKNQNSKAANQILSSRLSDTSHILLSTAVVGIADSSGEFHSCRVVLDAGSQSNFIAKHYCDKI